MLQRWHQDFRKLLNQQIEFDESGIQQTPLMPLYMDLDEPPTEEELEAAMAKIKRHKA